MAQHTVDVLIKARDEASAKFAGIGNSATRMGSLLKGVAASVGIYFGVTGIKNFAMSSLQAFADEEKIINNLHAALANLGYGNQIDSMIAFSEQMAKQTVYAHDTVLGIMKLGVSIGKLSGTDLQEATKAAIGLSRAFEIDLDAAMRLVSKGAAGVKVRMAGLGIEVKKGATDQEIYNEILLKGADGFKIAEAETKTYAGTMAQLKNAIEEVKEEIGGELAPTLQKSAEQLKNWCEQNRENVGLWVRNTLDGFALITAAYQKLPWWVSPYGMAKKATFEGIDKGGDAIQSGWGWLMWQNAKAYKEQLEKQKAAGLRTIRHQDTWQEGPRPGGGTYNPLDIFKTGAYGILQKMIKEGLPASVGRQYPGQPPIQYNEQNIERIKKILAEAEPPWMKPVTFGSITKEIAAQKIAAQGGKTPSWAPFESRFMTTAPGSRFDPAIETARTVKEQKDIQKQQLTEAKKTNIKLAKLTTGGGGTVLQAADL